ncbi:MAG: deoxyribose-phosphate aldolase [Actinomycetaceae bacterium]|nr:deoxyribose-phosphate aldolase [Actinomycetaceae bacterium]
MRLTRSSVAAIIDHTLLKPEATRADIDILIQEAETLGCGAVCLSPSLLPLSRLTSCRIACVCGFPSGASLPDVKIMEGVHAVSRGAQEIDVVINLANVMEHNYAGVDAELQALRRALPYPTVLKVIIESALLSDDQIVSVCQAAMAAECDFVKTSTGFHPAGGASVHAVELMAHTVDGRLGVKASGGIRDGATAKAMIAAGATRLGLSSSATVLEDFDD